MRAPYPFSPIVDRQGLLKWPDGKHLAVWVTPNFEVFRLDLPIPGEGPAAPNVPAYAERDYGNRVGVWRVMKVLSRYGIRGTAALNAEVCDVAPRIVEEAQALGWEFMGHGLTNSIRLNDSKNVPDEAEHIERTLDKIAKLTGQRPKGWLGPGLQETERTLDLLARSGIAYVADWAADDQPFWMTTKFGPLISIPYARHLNDRPVFTSAGQDPRLFTEFVRRSFDTLYEESRDIPGFFR